MMESQGKQIVILGSTGSIGTQALAVCRNLGLRPAALTARSNIALLEAQARAFLPDLAVVEDPAMEPMLRTALADTPVRVAAGRSAIIEASTLPNADMVVGAIVGIAGLIPVLEAVKAGKTVALANKEPLVAAGALITDAARDSGGKIIPVDSEHSAIFQCLNAGIKEDVTGVLLTASGGPFFGKKKRELTEVTPWQAVNHPNWEMGAKISVDSATLMNKGLELMEAMWLFDLEVGQIEIAVHRQSVLHSAVYFADGSLVGQMSLPDMRAAIQYALTYPRRYPVEGLGRLSLTDFGALTFEKPDRTVFDCLCACESAARRGGLYPAAVNAANEAAVALFLEEKLSFLGIGELVREAVEQLHLPMEATLENIFQADAQARVFVRERAARG